MLAAASDDLRFAAAVAQLGMLLRGSAHRGDATWAGTLALAEQARGDDPSCHRAELAGLVARAAELAGSPTKLARAACKS